MKGEGRRLNGFPKNELALKVGDQEDRRAGTSLLYDYEIRAKEPSRASFVSIQK